MEIDINKQKYDFKDLNDIMSFLLGEEGCPWDRAQTHESVMECLIEECYEVIDAVKRNDKENLCEELGDVLLQVVFNAKMSENDGGFDIGDVIDGISKKMISRHTHIFGNDESQDKDGVLDIWEENKKKEKGYSTVKESMELVPKTFPALIRAQKIQKKASKVGYGCDDISENIDEMISQLTQLKESIKLEKNDIFDKYGEFLLKSADISRFLKINPELALTNALETYINKFENYELSSERNNI